MRSHEDIVKEHLNPIVQSSGLKWEQVLNSPIGLSAKEKKKRREVIQEIKLHSYTASNWLSENLK